ncbi:MAG: type II secretion system protein GspE [Gemmatimonadales bacterium]|nr:MAG: type II secretion system protein GspE [Gemmatimonadales bacterium]
MKTRPRTPPSASPVESRAGSRGAASSGAPFSDGRPRGGGTARLLGTLLVEAGVLTADDLGHALVAQQRTGERLGELVARLGLASEEAVAESLARQLGLEYAAPPLLPDPGAVALVPSGLALRRRILPLSVTPRGIRVAMVDPLDLTAVDDLQFHTGRRVTAAVAPACALREAIRLTYGLPPAPSSERREAPEPDGVRTEGEPTAAEELGSLAADGPVVRLVDQLLGDAAEAGASDLHLEPRGSGLVIRARVDGILRMVTEVPGTERASVLSRIKVMAGMDISVRMRPQDGGFRLVRGSRHLSVRASTLPVEEGEKAVLRILDPSQVPSGLDELGLSPDDLARLRAVIRMGRGVVLAAGPTGSGKSSTLFGAMGEVDRSRQNVVTLEDPIEYRVVGVNQVQVHPRAGLTFPAALRAVLRQDPDVIMVGEIRDRETAEIAMAAAVTGHLVLSTIHTTDAPGGITRLLQMGVPPHLVAGGLSGIVAQRLVRVRCGDCGGRADGCPSCHEGYRGRTGVFELLIMDEALRDEVMRGAGTEILRKRAREGGMGSMASDARRKVAEGVTTPHEVARVLHRDPGSRPPCARCGNELSPGARGCPACGKEAEAVCRCGTRLQGDWRFCPECLRPATPPC